MSAPSSGVWLGAAVVVLLGTGTWLALGGGGSAAPERDGLGAPSPGGTTEPDRGGPSRSDRAAGGDTGTDGGVEGAPSRTGRGAGAERAPAAPRPSSDIDLTGWLDAKWKVEWPLRDRLRTGELTDEEVAQFNQKSDELLEQLVEIVGSEEIAPILDLYVLYRIDENDKSLLRVRTRGRYQPVGEDRDRDR